MEEEEEDDATETTEMLIDVENLEIEGEEGGRRGGANMSRIEFWARGGLNQSCGKKSLSNMTLQHQTSSLSSPQPG